MSCEEIRIQNPYKDTTRLNLSCLKIFTKIVQALLNNSVTRVLSREAQTPYLHCPPNPKLPGEQTAQRGPTLPGGHKSSPEAWPEVVGYPGHEIVLAHL